MDITKSDFNDLFYVVEVEGRVFKTEFNYGGFRECQFIVQQFGLPNKSYKVRVVNSKGEEVED